MNLLSGLEKFGLKAEDTTNLFAEEKKEVVGEDGTKQEAVPTEDSFLLDKAVRCAVCDKVFKTKMIKSVLSPTWICVRAMSTSTP